MSIMGENYAVQLANLNSRVVQGDCLEVLAALPEGCVVLVYLDPPFNTGRDHAATCGRYTDRWGPLDAYLRELRPRIEQIHRVLKPTGSILLHCDWRTSHHVRLMLDTIFGSEH